MNDFLPDYDTRIQDPTVAYWEALLHTYAWGWRGSINLELFPATYKSYIETRQFAQVCSDGSLWSCQKYIDNGDAEILHRFATEKDLKKFRDFHVGNPEVWGSFVVTDLTEQGLQKIRDYIGIKRVLTII